MSILDYHILMLDNFKINEKDIKDGFSGTYFNDIPTKVSVAPQFGYTFSHWETYSDLFQSQILFDQGAEWKYLDTGSDPGVEWVLNGYDDSWWQSGLAQLGYGDGDEKTVLSFGGESK